MGFGGGTLLFLAMFTGGFAVVADFGPLQWAAACYLGIFGGAAAFYLWVFALERTTPTRVANTMTINPVAASTVAALVIGEPIGPNLIFGIAAVAAGIWIASTDASRHSPAE
jgi:drug/metabolite transporter (DMT)-like permease